MLICVANVVATAAACVAFLALARTSLPQNTLRIDRIIVVLAATAVTLAGSSSSGGWQGCALDVLLAALAISTWTDIRTGLILDRVLAPCGSVVMLLALASGSQLAALAGATACGVTILLLWLMSGRRGIGLGDAKLAALLGGVLGAANGMFSVGAAFITGACYVGALAIAGRLPTNRSIVFGPFLGAGGVLAILWHAVGVR